MSGNSLRDEMKDQFRNYLVDCIPGDEDVINEAVCDLADIAFDLIGIAPEEQDIEYPDILRTKI